MRQRRWLVASSLGVIAVSLLAGCASSCPATPPRSAVSYGPAPGLRELTVLAPEASDAHLTASGSTAEAALPVAPGGATMNSWRTLPCEGQLTTAHVRLVGGVPIAFGDDAGNACCYTGVDLGVTGSRCLGVDAFYRFSGLQVDRLGAGEDGGTTHRAGVKATIERSLPGTALYGWAGAGPEVLWTEGYLDDDLGWGGYAEAGVGWRLSTRWRLRAGVGVHADRTSLTREWAQEDGKSRWLLTVVPQFGVEFDF